jgi:hypothetical protein
MTGREYYELAQATDQIPHKDPDLEFYYLVNWFWELRDYLSDYTYAITPSLVLDWIKLMGELPSSDDCAILFAMDSAYRRAIASAINKRNMQK